MGSLGPKSANEPQVFQGDFAEILLDEEWMKIEIIERTKPSGGYCLVQRIDGRGPRFEVNAKELVPLGSNDHESEFETQKRVEYERLEELLKDRGYIIEKVEGDGNCLFRAVAR